MHIQGGWRLVCLILAAVCFFLATVVGPWSTNPPSPYWSRLVSGGLCFGTLAFLVN